MKQIKINNMNILKELDRLIEVRKSNLDSGLIKLESRDLRDAIIGYQLEEDIQLSSDEHHRTRIDEKISECEFIVFDKYGFRYETKFPLELIKKYNDSFDSYDESVHLELGATKIEGNKYLLTSKSYLVHVYDSTVHTDVLDKLWIIGMEEEVDNLNSKTPSYASGFEAEYRMINTSNDYIKVLGYEVLEDGKVLQLLFNMFDDNVEITYFSLDRLEEIYTRVINSDKKVFRWLK